MCGSLATELFTLFVGRVRRPILLSVRSVRFDPIKMRP